MAGAGYRDWVAGEKPTAVMLDTYLQEQTVMVFASASARNTALSAVLAEGLHAFLLDTNTLTVYSGSAWSTIGPAHGALTSWTPTVTQSGSVTVTVTRAVYSRVGRWVSGYCVLAVTGSGTAANAVVISLPVDAHASMIVNGIIGAGFVFDVSATEKYRGIAVVGAAASGARIMSTGTVDGFVGTVGFTAGLASGDTLGLQFQYEAAADA